MNKKEFEYGSERILNILKNYEYELRNGVRYTIEELKCVFCHDVVEVFQIDTPSVQAKRIREEQTMRFMY